MIAVAPESLPAFYFISGVLFSIILIGLWRAARFFMDLRSVRRRAREIELSRPHDDKKAQEAWARVSACRGRLRFNPNPNPEWVAPLIDEIPRLVREIASIYYPDHPDPLQAPRLSEFARAIQFMATDIAELLQSRRMGRLIDISAGQTFRAWKTGHRVWKDPVIQRARGLLQPLVKVGKPIWQVARYNSPITWISLTASNAAIRTIHPSIVNIIARRAIDLYSGHLGEISREGHALVATSATPEENQLVVPETKRSGLFRSLKRRIDRRLRNR